MPPDRERWPLSGSGSGAVLANAIGKSTSLEFGGAAHVPDLAVQERAQGLNHLVPAALLLYAILLPQDIRLTVGGVNLFAYRLVCFALLPWILAQISRGRMRLSLPDIMIFAGGAWMVLSFMVFYGAAEGLISGMGLAVDVVAPYLVARVSIHSASDLRKLLIIFAPGIFVAGLFVVVESISHREIIKPFFQSIFGAREAFISAATGDNKFRLGLMRAGGPFAHPILAGLILASIGTLFLSSGLRRWPLYSGLLAAAMAIFTVSSAAFLALFIALGFTAYDRISRFIPFLNWPIFVFGASLIALFIQLASSNGLILFIVRFTLDPATGYFRRLIWRYGTESVIEHPWFGIAFSNYERLSWMNNSVDAYWLSDAMRHGLVTPIMFLAASIATIVFLARMAVHAATETDRRFYVGIAIAITTLVLMGFTVAYFGGVLLWYYFLLGAGVALSVSAAESRS